MPSALAPVVAPEARLSKPDGPSSVDPVWPQPSRYPSIVSQAFARTRDVSAVRSPSGLRLAAEDGGTMFRRSRTDRANRSIRVTTKYRPREDWPMPAPGYFKMSWSVLLTS